MISSSPPLFSSLEYSLFCVTWFFLFTESKQWVLPICYFCNTGG
jgi:hypothetical protein